MNHYYTSDGIRVSKAAIDQRVRRAKAKRLEIQRTEHGYNYCQKCGRSSGVYLDCAHDVSVDKCQKTGRAELAWDTSNIKILCRECHSKHDNLNLQWGTDIQ